MARSRPLLALTAVCALFAVGSVALPWPADGLNWKSAALSRLPALKWTLSKKSDCKTVFNVRSRLSRLMRVIAQRCASCESRVAAQH